VTRFHKALRFKSSPYLRKSVKYFMELRQMLLEGKDEIMASIFKQMMVALFGKFLCNTSTHNTLKLCTTKAECIDFTSRHNFNKNQLYIKGAFISSPRKRNGSSFLQHYQRVSNAGKLLRDGV
jgi:hypothetical protein